MRADGDAPVLIVANQPTWGLDIGAVAFVHQQLLDACARGAAVLLDLRRPRRDLRARRPHRGDARGPADRRRGRVREWDLPTIGLAMAGATPVRRGARMRLEARGEVSRLMLVGAPFAAVAFTLVVVVAVRRLGGRAARPHLRR